MFQRHLLVFALAIVVPSISPAVATAQWGPEVRVEFGYREGYDRGTRAGSDDLRRGAAFDFSINGEFRRGDYGYRSQYGNRDRYRNEFRRGFEAGYRSAYRDMRGGRGPGWQNGGRGFGRFDAAVRQGRSDGYEAGLDDARDGRRFDPIGERRYRSADRGYDRSYGNREFYKTNYRSGFRSGYEEGYRDATRYGRRW